MQGATTGYSLYTQELRVSIHAPYAGSDYQGDMIQWITLMFQSTPPMQGATFYIQRDNVPHLFQSTPPMQGATQTP